MAMAVTDKPACFGSSEPLETGAIRVRVLIGLPFHPWCAEADEKVIASSGHRLDSCRSEAFGEHRLANEILTDETGVPDQGNEHDAPHPTPGLLQRDCQPVQTTPIID
ncbi:MAG: hypothetical protein IPP90_12925 [Gemmatimonadaceae bacterium]|nr:hypothetical protein [Gemmatimonadaceae bacterium]